MASSSAAPTADVFGAYPSVSDDGRMVVFEGLPTDGSERDRTIWLRDVSVFGSHDVELTVPVDGMRLGNSVRPTISGDGCVVAMVTEMAFDLFRDDDGGDRWDVYRQVLPACGGTLGDWELVSTQSSSDGDTRALDRVVPDEAPAMSRVGTVIAFSHRARSKDDLLAVSVVDVSQVLGSDDRIHTVGGTPLLIPNTTFRYVGQREPDVSADGRFVTYTSDAISDATSPQWADGPVPGEFATSQVYVWDRFVDQFGGLSSPVTLVSKINGLPAADGGHAPVISGDGRFIAFESASADLAGNATLPECGSVCATQVFRSDTATGAIVLVSREQTLPDQTFVAADGGASQATISDDGSQVGFVTRSHNLFATESAAGIEATDGDIVVSDVDLGVLRRASTLADGVTPSPASNAHPALTASGHVVVFDTLSANLLIDSGSIGRQVVSMGRPAHVTAPALDVGTVAITFPGPEWFIAIRNDGPSTFLPAKVESTNPDFAITGGTCGLGLPVPPGQACEVHIVLTPSVAGPIVGDIIVSESVFQGISVTTSVAGAGGEPALTPTPFSGLDFPVTEVGRTSAPISTGVANIGFAPTVISHIKLAGDDPDDFVISSDGCMGYALNPGATCSIDVSFVPKEPGYRTATVVISNDLGQYTTVLVNGTGTREVRLEAATPAGRAGIDLGLGGSGFSPGAPISISWADGRGDSITLNASTDGGFLVMFPTRPNDRAGDRVLVAQSGDQIAKTTVTVLRRAVATGPGSPVWGG
ncbi:MAG: hypothetical protein RLZZ623_2500 [Actinomycetota bacterium]